MAEKNGIVGKEEKQEKQRQEKIAKLRKYVMSLKTNSDGHVIGSVGDLKEAAKVAGFLIANSYLLSKKDNREVSLLIVNMLEKIRKNK